MRSLTKEILSLVVPFTWPGNYKETSKGTRLIYSNGGSIFATNTQIAIKTKGFCYSGTYDKKGNEAGKPYPLADKIEKIFTNLKFTVETRHPDATYTVEKENFTFDYFNKKYIYMGNLFSSGIDYSRTSLQVVRYNEENKYYGYNSKYLDLIQQQIGDKEYKMFFLYSTWPSKKTLYIVCGDAEYIISPYKIGKNS